MTAYGGLRLIASTSGLLSRPMPRAEIVRPGSWQGLDVAARCLLLSRPLRESLPIWGPRRRESSMSKPGFDGRHRNKDGEIGGNNATTHATPRQKFQCSDFEP